MARSKKGTATVGVGPRGKTNKQLQGSTPTVYVADNPQLIPAATTAGFTFIGSGTMLGPPLAGFLFDRSGEYYLSFGCAAGMMVLGAATMCLPLRCFGGDGAEKRREYLRSNRHSYICSFHYL